MILIPVTSQGNSSVEVSIEGIVYTLEQKYNTRNKRLYLSISAAGNYLINSLKLLEDKSPDIQYVSDSLPHGVFYVLPTQKVSEFSTLGNTGIDEPYVLVYYTDAEIEDILNGIPLT